MEQPHETNVIEDITSSFIIPDTAAHIREAIEVLNEKIDEDIDNQQKKAHAVSIGLPEAAMTKEVRYADEIYKAHQQQLRMLKESLASELKKAA